MFTLSQIKEAHAKVKSGADFSQYIQDLVSLGILKYTIYVCDGHAGYTGKDDYNITSEAEYPTLQIAEKVDISKFKSYLKIHQEGRTDYFTFCKNSAESGIEKWIVDVIKRTCSYYGESNKFILEEKILI